MILNRKIFIVGVILGIVFLGVSVIPVTWAMPEQGDLPQTFPTRTPRVTRTQPPPTMEPTDEPQPTQPPPSPTPTAEVLLPTDTPNPSVTSTSTAQPLEPTVTSSPTVASTTTSTPPSTATLDASDSPTVVVPSDELTLTSTLTSTSSPITSTQTPQSMATLAVDETPATTTTSEASPVEDAPSTTASPRESQLPIGRWGGGFLTLGLILVIAGVGFLIASRRSS
jgi:hypothetical protein